MLRLLWLIPAIPFASFIVLALVGSRISKKLAARSVLPRSLPPR